MVAALAEKPPTIRLPLDAIRVDGGTQVRTRIDGDAVNDYARALERLPPVTVVHDGHAYWLADGFHRVAAHRQVGAAEIEALVVEGTKRDAVLFACGANRDHGVRRSNADKRSAVKRVLTDAEWCTWTDREIAEVCGVSHPFVGQMRRALLGGGNGYHPPDEGDDEPFERELDDLPEPDVGKSAGLAALTSSANNEWYTPAEFVDAAREVMGGIDVDPASSEVANRVVGATRFYCEAEDGLTQPWEGKVWLNPPYGWTGVDGKDVPAQGLWSERLFDEHAEGRVEQACLMVTAKTCDLWFQPLWDWPLCFVAGRVGFTPGAGQKETNNPQGQVIAYLGDRVEQFERAFAKFGRIVVPTPFGSASLRTQHKALCTTCGKPCSSGRWCPTCKQHERGDRRWRRAAMDIAKREVAAGKTPSPRQIAVRVRAPWTDVVKLFIKQGIGTEKERAEWQREAHQAKRGD